MIPDRTEVFLQDHRLCVIEVKTSVIDSNGVKQALSSMFTNAITSQIRRQQTARGPVLISATAFCDN
jgi:hypothetical protein